MHWGFGIMGVMIAGSKEEVFLELLRVYMERDVIHAPVLLHDGPAHQALRRLHEPKNVPLSTDSGSQDQPKEPTCNQTGLTPEEQKPRATSGSAKPTASTATNILKPNAGYTSIPKASSLTDTPSPSHAKMRLSTPVSRPRSPSRKMHSLPPAADATSTATELVSKTSTGADMEEPLITNSKNRIDQIKREGI
jgi:hypothetical protein